MTARDTFKIYEDLYGRNYEKFYYLQLDCEKWGCSWPVGDQNKQPIEYSHLSQYSNSIQNKDRDKP